MTWQGFANFQAWKVNAYVIFLRMSFVFFLKKQKKKLSLMTNILMVHTYVIYKLLKLLALQPKNINFKSFNDNGFHSNKIVNWKRENTISSMNGKLHHLWNTMSILVFSKRVKSSLPCFYMSWLLKQRYLFFKIR